MPDKRLEKCRESYQIVNCKVCNKLVHKRYSYKERRNKYFRHKRKTVFNYRLSCNLRDRVKSALRGISKSKPTFELLGETIEKIKAAIKAAIEAKGVPVGSELLLNQYAPKISQIAQATLESSTKSLSIALSIDTTIIKMLLNTAILIRVDSKNVEQINLLRLIEDAIPHPKSTTIAITARDKSSILVEPK